MKSERKGLYGGDGGGGALQGGSAAAAGSDPHAISAMRRRHERVTK